MEFQITKKSNGLLVQPVGRTEVIGVMAGSYEQFTRFVEGRCLHSHIGLYVYVCPENPGSIEGMVFDEMHSYGTWYTKKTPEGWDDLIKSRMRVNR